MAFIEDDFRGHSDAWILSYKGFMSSLYKSYENKCYSYLKKKITIKSG